MIDPLLHETLHSHLFVPGIDVYALLDGAATGLLPYRLRRSGEDYACLFRGHLDPLIEASAPWLVRLRPRRPLTDFVLRQCWHRRRGVLLRTPEYLDVHTLRSHLRRFLRVDTPAGSRMFRLCDPQVFRAMAPALDARTRRDFFAPIHAVCVEDDAVDRLWQFDIDHAHGRCLQLSAHPQRRAGDGPRTRSRHAL
jgi:hypothetical protein